MITTLLLRPRTPLAHRIPSHFRALASRAPPGPPPPQTKKRHAKPRRDLTIPFKPAAIEDGWYRYWSTHNCFEPSPTATKPPIRMLLPPPNVTGELHIGHALMLSIEDALARFYRMKGHPVIWAPGTDHAGIATQSVVERKLLAEQGVTRQELGRDAFIAEVEDWRRKSGRRILEQSKRVGASTTASREYYTGDPGLSQAVVSAFVRLWEEGLVYRDTRMVNWSVQLQTAVSDIEVVTREISGAQKVKVEGAEFGVIHEFAFPLVEGEGEIVVSTTRPETIPGDRAVAVHPDDERYKHLHYKFVRHPLIPDVTLPIVPDAELVDPSFGSGAVKITPAHDAADYAFWKRHSTLSPSPSDTATLPIPLVAVFDATGKMTSDCQVDSLIGHDRLHIRKLVVQLLKDAGVHRGEKPHDVRLPTCERSGCVIEPMLQPQWYLRMKPLAERVKAVAARDGLEFAPEQPYEQLWNQWLDGIQDWCLSRQIWWGHRIPAYMVVDGAGTVRRWVAAEGMEAARAQLTDQERAERCDVKQDEDVLDTWFSSGLLPLSTAGWRGGNGDLPGWRENYPLSFIESGGDILFFWLARMAMLCTHFTDKLPFPEIILHPLVCDSTGRKMSKSVGNVLDPLLIIAGERQANMVNAMEATYHKQIHRGGEQAETAKKEMRRKAIELRKRFPNGIAESGADALRMALLDYTKQQRQINMELRHVDVFRKFAIKLDNACKFLITTRDRVPFRRVPIMDISSPHDRYLIYHLQELVKLVEASMDIRKFSLATEALRSFTYDVLCGVYLEFAKHEVSDTANPDRRDQVLSLIQHALDMLLRLMHPFMPFLTEGLWQELWPEKRAEVDWMTIMKARWPVPEELPEVPPEWTELEIAMQAIAVLKATENRESVEVKVPGGRAWEYANTHVKTMVRLARYKGRVNIVPGEVLEDLGAEVDTPPSRFTL